MVRYKRVKGGEKNKLSGTPFSKDELNRVCDLYIELEGKSIHENNPDIHELALQLNRTVRSVENQLLGFKAVDTKETGRAHHNKFITSIWTVRGKELRQKQENKKLETISRQKNKRPERDFKFRISSQLKNIIGKELITDDHIAIFELVKNSFDAHAKKVKIIFEKNKIIIWDNGKGMDKNDILNKWLFVAYSAKKDGTEDLEFTEKKTTYRDKISPKKSFAGAKGIGRFSSDRLGATLKLTTRKITKNSLYWNLQFNWDIFEQDAEEEFVDIELSHNSSTTTKYKNFNHGVILEITNLRSVWSRKKILALKWSLEKLINPFANIDKKDGNGKFSIEISARHEFEKDSEIKAEIQKDPDTKLTYRDIVNGEVKNFIFETLGIKTTLIQSIIQKDKIITQLVDRGTLIYSIEEDLNPTLKRTKQNPFHYIPIGSKIQLFYLNFGAKNNFTRLMGIESVNFGSVFLFNNGFRIFPIGEPGDDPFGIDKRKAQGYNRYLGTRELIGSIEIWGKSEHFQEASSRDGGLIETPATKQLELFFLETLKKLEKYVRPILWSIKKRTGSENEDIDVGAKTEIINLIAKLAGTNQIKLLSYSKKFLNIMKEKTADTSPKVFESLKKIAQETGDKSFADEIDKGKIEFLRLKKEKEEEERKRIEAEQKTQIEIERRKKAEEELKRAEEKRKEAEYNRLKAEEERRLAEQARRTAEDSYARERKKNLFFNSIGKVDSKATSGLIHHIKLTSTALNRRIDILAKDIVKNKFEPKKSLEILSELRKYSSKIQKLSEIVSYSDINFKYAKHPGNLVAFISEYIQEIKSSYPDIKFMVNTNDVEFETDFSILETSIVLDNLIANSYYNTKSSKKVQLDIKKSGDGIKLIFSDNGSGVDESIKSHIFDIGFSTSRGSGIGLYMVKEIMSDLGGAVKFLGNNKVLSGASFELKF